MKFLPLEIPDVILIEPQVYGDDRGFFLETWSDRVFAEANIPTSFVQDNWSRSARGVLRGLHYQVQHSQGKLVRCVRGEVFDVAVDIRRSSKHFGCWVGQVLSEENKLAMWVPPGFAHGFLTLSEIADFQYKCTDIYHPQSERTISWNDLEIGVEWPLTEELQVQLSGKDAQHGISLQAAECFE